MKQENTALREKIDALQALLIMPLPQNVCYKVISKKG